MTEIRIIVRCTKFADTHAKVVRFAADLGLGYAQTIADVLEGKSEFLLNKIGDNSPFGKCAICGSALRCIVAEVEVKPKTKGKTAPWQR